MSQDPVLARLFANNAQWAVDVERVEPGFFTQCAKGQAPKVLWIGCADSRVPESVLTVSRPGDIFVHRNIANQFHLHDDNALAALTYAIHIGVSHIVLVGHSQCGGAAACYEAANASPAPGPPTTALERWLAPMTALAKEHGYSAAELVEANVRVGVQNIVDSDVMQNAWAQGKEVQVHGWVYEIEKGRLKDLGVSVGRQSARGPD